MEIAFAAGRALAAGFLGEEVLGHAEEVEDAGAVVNDEDRAGADGDARLFQVVVRVRRVEDAAVGDLARRAAELDQAQRMAAGDSLPEVENDVAYRGAERNLIDAGTAHIAAEADELRAKGFPGAVAHIFALVVHQEVRHDCEAFHVVDAGGKRKQAADLHEGRLHARTARLALNGADQRRAFAADVSACAGV